MVKALIYKITMVMFKIVIYEITMVMVKLIIYEITVVMVKGIKLETLWSQSRSEFLRLLWSRPYFTTSLHGHDQGHNIGDLDMVMVPILERFMFRIKVKRDLYKMATYGLYAANKCISSAENVENMSSLVY